MPQLVVVNFVSLDGIVQSVLSADEDRSGGFTHGGWVTRHMDDDVASFMSATTTRAAAMLLGRRTYQGFAAVWPVADPEEPAVAAMNTMPKYVASRAQPSLSWANSRLLGPDLERDVRQLKARTDDGEIVIFGSADLIRTLSALNLIDEYRLLTFPVVLGSGKRLFGHQVNATTLTLTSCRTTTSGVVITSYVPGQRPEPSPPAET